MRWFFRALRIAVAATLLASTPAWALKPVQPVYTDIEAAKGKQYSATKVQQAFKTCGGQRGWRFSSDGSGKMVGQLTVRGKHYVAVDIQYSGKAFNITYRDSKNMKYNPSKNTIHNRYSSWVENLSNDVLFCLN